MVIIYKNNKEYVLRFDKGDKYLQELKNFLDKEKISGAFFYGLGGFLEAEIAFYDLKSREYINKKIEGPLEVASLHGNAAESEEGLVVHNHVVLGDKDYRAYAGHLVDGVVGGTLEIYLTKLGKDDKIKRIKDEETGLNLFNSG